MSDVHDQEAALSPFTLPTGVVPPTELSAFLQWLAGRTPSEDLRSCLHNVASAVMYDEKLWSVIPAADMIGVRRVTLDGLVDGIGALHWRLQIHDRDKHGIAPIDFDVCPEEECVLARNVAARFREGKGGSIAGGTGPGTLGGSHPNVRESHESGTAPTDDAAMARGPIGDAWSSSTDDDGVPRFGTDEYAPTGWSTPAIPGIMPGDAQPVPVPRYSMDAVCDGCGQRFGAHSMDLGPWIRPACPTAIWTSKTPCSRCGRWFGDHLSTVPVPNTSSRIWKCPFVGALDSDIFVPSSLGLEVDEDPPPVEPVSREVAASALTAAIELLADVEGDTAAGNDALIQAIGILERTAAALVVPEPNPSLDDFDIENPIAGGEGATMGEARDDLVDRVKEAVRLGNLGHRARVRYVPPTLGIPDPPKAEEVGEMYAEWARGEHARLTALYADGGRCPHAKDEVGTLACGAELHPVKHGRSGQPVAWVCLFGHVMQAAKFEAAT